MFAKIGSISKLQTDSPPHVSPPRCSCVFIYATIMAGPMNRKMHTLMYWWTRLRSATHKSCYVWKLAVNTVAALIMYKLE